jgi:RNA polymerase sigma-70 factor, ECF subfamily
MFDTASDEELAGLVQKGDEMAFAVLMERYTGKLMRYGQRFLSTHGTIGDSVQDIFVTVYKNIHDFDTTRRFSPWIYRIAHNVFIDVIRKKSRDPLPFFNIDTIFPHTIYEDPSENEKEDAELRVLLKEGLGDLAPRYKEIIDLHYFENFSYKEIADILHIPVGTVGVRLARARDALRKKIPKQDHEN